MDLCCNRKKEKKKIIKPMSIFLVVSAGDKKWVGLFNHVFHLPQSPIPVAKSLGEKV